MNFSSVSLKFIFFLFVLFFAKIDSTYAATPPPVESCAVSNESVAPHDFSICKEDLSFKTLYEFFPDIWEDSVFSFFDFDYLNDLGNDEDTLKKTQYLKFSNLFKKSLVIISNISFFCIFLLIMYKSIIGILNTIESGKFLGGKWKPSIAIKSGIITMALLLPVGEGVMVVNVLVLLLATAAISLANYLYGYYLSFLETFNNNLDINEIIANKQKSLEYETTIEMKGHNSFYADMYVNAMAKIEVCRHRTAQYQLENMVSEVKDYNVEMLYSCGAPKTDKVEYFYTNNPNHPDFDKDTFIKYKLSESAKLDSTDYMQVSRVLFGKNKSSDFNCRDFQSYSCGEISVVTPNASSSTLINDFLKDDYYKILNDVQLSLNNDSISNYNLIKNGWEKIKEKALSELEIYVNNGGSDSFLNLLSKDILNEDLTIKDDSAFKHLSYVYHTSILNSLLVGHVDLKIINTEDSKSNVFGNSTNIKPFLDNYSEIKKLSYLVQEYQCMVNSSDLDGTLNLRSKILDGSEIQKSSFRCINYETLSHDNVDVFGTKSNEIVEGGYTKEELEEAKKEILDLQIKIKEKIYSHREITELAFTESMVEFTNNGLLRELRKKGWLTFGSYLLQINKEVNSNQRFKKSFVNNMDFNISNINNKYISNDVYIDTEKRSNLYQDITSRSNPLLEITTNKKLDNSYFMDSSMKTKYAIENGASGDSDSNEIMKHLEIFINPLGAIKDAMGMKGSGWLMDTEIDYVELCTTDMTNCPIPKGNPFIQLNTVGHYFINNATAYYGAVVMISTASLLYQKATSNFQKDTLNEVTNSSGGSIDNKYENQSEKQKKLKKTRSKYSILDLIGSFLEMMNTFMFFMLLAGLLMAYLIPILPFMYFLVGFLNWFVLIIKLFLVSPIWASFFINYDENKDKLIGFFKTQVLEVILKPIFLVASLIFVWSLYSAIIFYVNLTIIPMLKSLHSDGLIMSMISGIMLSVVFLFIVYIITSKIFDILNDVYAKMFEMIEVQVSREDNEHFNNFIQYLAIREGLNIGQNAVGKTNFVKTNLKQTKFYESNRKNLWDQLNKENNKKTLLNRKSRRELIKTMEKKIKETRNWRNIYGKL